MKKLILDTDVGTDVDDAFAIALAASAPELKLEAVTTVYGDVELRARMARKLLDLLGREDVPVAPGLRQPLTSGREVYWGGWEGRGFLAEEDGALAFPRRGIELLLHLLRTAEEPLTLVAIGPLTNVAALLQAAPELAASALEEIICMAGTLVPDEEEWNVQCDPRAARIVFESGVPVRLGTRFIVNQPKLRPHHRERLLTSQNPAVRSLVTMLDVFLGEKQRDTTPMYDPVTLSMAYTDEFIQTERVGVRVRMEGDVVRLERDPESARHLDVSISVRPDEFVDHLVERLVSL
jgi:purine nucleosidase